MQTGNSSRSMTAFFFILVLSHESPIDWLRQTPSYPRVAALWLQ
jgi:hypothetical protein